MKTIALLFFALVGTCVAAVWKPSDGFKKKMLPRVGTEVTASGALKFGKLGLYLELGEDCIWILGGYDGAEYHKWANAPVSRTRRVRVTGILRHTPYKAFPTSGMIVSPMMEHFYFDFPTSRMRDASARYRPR